jgi:hypothetical protein
MPDSDPEAKRLGAELPAFANLLETVCMYPKSDDEKLYRDLLDKSGIKLLTVPRKETDKSEGRQLMTGEQMKAENRQIYRQRGAGGRTDSRIDKRFIQTGRLPDAM